MEKIELGDLVRDRISGFTGIAEAITYWLNACERVSVRPRKLKEDGTPINSVTFDMPQLELIEKGAVKAWAPTPEEKTGGPSIDPVAAPGISYRD